MYIYILYIQPDFPILLVAQSCLELLGLRDEHRKMIAKRWGQMEDIPEECKRRDFLFEYL